MRLLWKTLVGGGYRVDLGRFVDPAPMASIERRLTRSRVCGDPRGALEDWASP